MNSSKAEPASSKQSYHGGPSHGGARNHAGSGLGPSEPEIPQPSHAERARTLLHCQRTGYLSSQSRKCPGFPFGSVMPYSLDPTGCPVFLISKMAMHTQNLDRDPRASLLVPEEGSAGRNPLGIARVTLLGEARPVTEGLEPIRDHYLKQHESARYWVDYGDFGFYRLEVVDVYFVGGFGVMGWVEEADYRQASADPLADHSSHILEHMNSDHADALVLLASAYADLDPKQAAMTAVDRLGFHLRLEMEGRYRGCRIAFPREVRTPKEVRKILVEMVKKARNRGAEQQSS